MNRNLSSHVLPSHVRFRPRNRGFTLVELLVVIAIIGILVALLLPAIQAARESARRMQCIDHLKNLTLAMVNHEATSGRLPSSGWSGNWTGDPDRGTGAEQPGCWAYSVLPFIEEQAIYDLGRGATGAARVALLQKRDATPVAIMNCPSRRSGGPYPRLTGGNALSGNGTGLAGGYAITQAARGDYAVNVGDETLFDDRCISISPQQYNATIIGFPPSSDSYSGVSFCGTAVKLRQITDGLSKTIALGERWIPAATYESNQPWRADDWAMYVGFQDDTVRSTFYDGRTPSHVPIADTDDPVKIYSLPNLDSPRAGELFGGPHPGGCVFSRCDGSADMIAYDIDPEMFRQMGDRRDGGIIKVYSRRP